METIGILLFGTIVVIPILLWYSYAASILWGWFIVPIFHVDTLSSWQMLGIFLTIAAIRSRHDLYKEERVVDWRAFLFMLIGPAWLLGLGYLIKYWGLA